MHNKKSIPILDRICSAVGLLTDGAGRAAAYCVLIMTFIVTGDVLLRYLLNAPTNWILEFTGYLMVMVTFLGTAYTRKEKAHITITVITEKLSHRWRQRLSVIASVSFLAFSVFLGYLTWLEVQESFVRQTTSRTIIDVVLWPFQVFVPLGFALLSLVLLCEIYQETKTARQKLIEKQDSENGGIF